jgi:O-antigen ligase
MQVTAPNQVGIMTAVAVAIVAAALLVAPIEFAPVVLVAAAGLALFTSWCTSGRLIVAVCIWFVLVICFDEEFWRAEVPFFFNVTASRLFIVVLGLMWLGMWALGRSPLRFTQPALLLMGLILAYFTLSAAVSGFRSVAVASVHYRLIGGYWFAFAMFFLVLHAISRERDIMLLLAFLFGVGLYLTFTGWCEHFEIWSLVFPRYIADPTVGIHWGRVRGPFLVSATMGLALSFCFFSNIVFARRLPGPWRLPVWVATLLMLPPIFWTQTRSVWLGFLLGAVIWVAFNRRQRSRTATVAVLAALAIVVLAFNFENFSSSQRARGGVTDVEPVYLRLGLAMITWDMFTDSPLLGVGFGHFRDVAPGYARDVASPYYQFASPAMEHNSFLSILADTGLVGLGLYLGLLFALVKISIRLYRKLPDDRAGIFGRDVIILYWVLTAVYLADAMFRETSVHPFTNSLFFGISGIIAAMDWLLRPQPVASPHSWSASGNGEGVSGLPPGLRAR